MRPILVLLSVLLAGCSAHVSSPSTQPNQSSFNLKPGVSLGDAVAEVEQAARTSLPATVTGSFQGTAQAFQDSMRGLGWILLIAIFVIYVVLGMMYESFIHPLTILSGLPAAGFGALLTLMLFRCRPEHLRVCRRDHAGWPAGLADADAVRDAGLLHLHGSAHGSAPVRSALPESPSPSPTRTRAVNP
jgi:hypothetical protein